MSILIKGMEMPKEEEIGKCIIVRHDGEVWIVEFDNLIDGGYVCCYPPNPTRAVPVPPHGRLIDAEEFYNAISMDDRTTIPEEIHIRSLLSEAPTIIPAEEGET